MVEDKGPGNDPVSTRLTLGLGTSSSALLLLCLGLNPRLRKY